MVRRQPSAWRPTTAIELAREAKAPVRVAYDRHEELSVTGYRPATEVKIALLPSEQGELKALSLTAYADTGAATNSTIAALARLIYPAEAKELADFDVISNLPAGAPFRGPGGPPMAFALEQAIDEAALRMKVDPIALRKRWDPDPNRQRLYDWASGLEVWRNRKPIAAQSGRYRRGVGVATGYWLYLWQPGSKVEVAVKGGRLIASTATQDIGTGTRTVIANTVAQEFGLEPHEIEVRIGDSNLPEGPGSGGSRVTASIIPPMLLAIEQLKASIQQHAKRRPVPGSNAPWREMLAASPDLSVSSVRPEDSRPTTPGVQSPLKQVGFMGMIFGWMMRRFSNLAIGAGVPSSVQVIEVEVDTWLGHVRVVNVHTGIAIGKVAAPALARSQAAGAVIQGVGYALYEAPRNRFPHRRCAQRRHGGLSHSRHRGHASDRRAFRPGRLRARARRQRRHRRGRDRADLARDRQRNSQRDRRSADRTADPSRPSRRRAQREGRRMTPSAMTATHAGEFRAAGTDLSERRRSGVSTGPLIDISAAPDTIGMHWDADGSLRIGAFTSIAAIAADARLAAAYPGIAASALGLATPQIRHLATLGGNLAQRSRCWYFRNPHIACLKKGGSDCPARSGNHLYHVAFDLGPCVAPHPSTMAAALLAYEAKVTTDRRNSLTIGEASRRRLQRQRRQRAAAGRDDQEHRTSRSAARRARAVQARDQPHLCRMAAGRDLRPRRDQGRHLPVRPPRRRRHRPGAAAARRRGSRVAGQASQHSDDCHCRRTRGIRCKAAADDGIQTRSAERRREGSAGAAGGVTRRAGRSEAAHRERIMSSASKVNIRR